MIRSYSEGDRQAVLDINAANVPEVGTMDGAKFDLLLAEAVDVSVVDVDGQVVGFMILLGPGGTYGSPNYAWFSARYPEFVYVDRIALGEAARGQGWGPQLYERAAAATRTAGAPVLLAEVNTVPPNPRSLRFHEIFGFVEVGREQPYGGDEEVAMLACEISAG